MVGSGNSDMSDSLIAWKPRIDEPSKFSPSSKTDWSKEDTGTVKCCMIPGRSQKRTSTISTPSSFRNFSSSSLFANIRPPRSGHEDGPQVSVRNKIPVRHCIGGPRLGRTGFPTVSRLFRPCNTRWSPQAGPVNDTAKLGRRLLALVVDWLASTLVVILAIGPAGWLEDPASGIYVLGVFAAESAVLTALAGGSFGKLATGLRVVREDGSGRPVDLLRSLARSLLVCLVIPPLVYRPDRRGLHDMAAGSRTVSVR